MAEPLALLLPVIESFCQHGQLSQSLLERGVVRMGRARVLQEVLDEKHVARDSLDGLDEKVV